MCAILLVKKGEKVYEVEIEDTLETISQKLNVNIDLLLSKNYVYGYVENPPYEATLDKELVGIAGEYINRIERLTGIDFTYKKYETFNELRKSIDRGEVDIYFNYYNFIFYVISKYIFEFIINFSIRI